MIWFLERGDANKTKSPQPNLMEAANQQIYTAIYSGVPVYEVIIRDSPIMRRISDNYMNATQILKIAGFSKARRTKILENELVSGLYEKIQSGYGNYQGTWIPLENGRILAKRYGVAHSMANILDFNPIENVKSKQLTGIKIKNDGSALTPLLPGTKDSKNPSSNFSSPTDTTLSGRPEHAITKRTPVRSRAPSSSMLSPDQPTPDMKNQEPTPQYKASSTLSPHLQNPSVRRLLFDEESIQTLFINSVHERRNLKASEINFETSKIDNYNYSPPFKGVEIPQDLRNREILMHIFVKEDNALNNAYFFELLRDPVNQGSFDVSAILDDRKGTALHWAAACGRLNLTRLLLARGANPAHCDCNGETPLMKSIQSIHVFANRSMEELLTILTPSIFLVDQRKQTALHQIVLLSRYRSKRVISNYYMEAFSNFIEDTRNNSQISYIKFLDSGDENGETALHLACRYRNHRIVFLLVSLGASKLVPNLKGVTPASMADHDPRLKKLMTVLPEPEYDDYLDAPTTPTSDISELPELSELIDTSFSAQSEFAKNSSSTISSQRRSQDNSSIAGVAAQLSSCRVHISELRHQKHRFDEVLKYANKLQASLDQPATPQPVISNNTDENTIEENHKRLKLDRSSTTSQSMLMQETKLSSRLIRLESLIKASSEEQQELLRRVDLIKQERLLKDQRYANLISRASGHRSTDENNMDDLLAKLGYEF